MTPARTAPGAGWTRCECRSGRVAAQPPPRRVHVAVATCPYLSVPWCAAPAQCHAPVLLPSLRHALSLGTCPPPPVPSSAPTCALVLPRRCLPAQHGACASEAATRGTCHPLSSFFCTPHFILPALLPHPPPPPRGLPHTCPTDDDIGLPLSSLPQIASRLDSRVSRATRRMTARGTRCRMRGRPTRRPPARPPRPGAASPSLP